MANVYEELLAQSNGLYDGYQTEVERRKQETLQRLQAARAQEQQANYIAQRQIERSAPNLYAAQGYSGGPVATLDLQNKLEYENRRNDTARSYDDKLSEIVSSYEDYIYQLNMSRLQDEMNYKSLAAQAAQSVASGGSGGSGEMPPIEDIAAGGNGFISAVQSTPSALYGQSVSDVANQVVSSTGGTNQSIPLVGKFGVGGWNAVPTATPYSKPITTATKPTNYMGYNRTKDRM